MFNLLFILVLGLEVILPDNTSIDVHEIHYDSSTGIVLLVSDLIFKGDFDDK